MTVFDSIRSLVIGDHITYRKHTSTEIFSGVVTGLIAGEYVIVKDHLNKDWWESESQFVWVEKI